VIVRCSSNVMKVIQKGGEGGGGSERSAEAHPEVREGDSGKIDQKGASDAKLLTDLAEIRGKRVSYLRSRMNISAGAGDRRSNQPLNGLWARKESSPVVFLKLILSTLRGRDKFGVYFDVIIGEGFAERATGNNRLPAQDGGWGGCVRRNR